MTRRRVSPEVLLSALTGHAVLTALAWRDIARRDPAELRGSKALWRVLTAMNTTHHLAYWLIGRRR